MINIATETILGTLRKGHYYEHLRGRFHTETILGPVEVSGLCHVASVWDLFRSSFWGPREKKGRG
jgi:hypothetical protein